MSERLRNTAGFILLMISIVLIILQIPAETGNMKKYRPSKSSSCVPEKIMVENNGKIMINRAGSDELELLPGIGPAYAERIITERNENGPFYYPEDLTAVSGIGIQTLADIRKKIDMTLNEGGK